MGLRVADRSPFRRVLVVAAMIGAAAVPLGDSAAACAANHGRPFLAGFQGDVNAASRFYAVGEASGPGTVTIAVSPGHCESQSGSRAGYATQDGSAMAGEDYAATSGQTGVLCDDLDTPSYCNPAGGENPSDPVDVAISNPGTGTDTAVESFLFTLTSGQPLGLAEPASAPVHIVDDDGAARASLEPTLDGTAPVAYQKLEFGTVKIPVFRAGPGSTGSVGFTVEPDPSSPAQPGVDYQVMTPSPLSVGAGRVGFIQIDIIGDRDIELDESLVITLQPGAGLTPVQGITTTFTILDNEEGAFPTSRFHHPRHGLRYPKNDYRIREIHIFTEDTGGSGVVAAELALRRNMRNGNCAWMTKRGWRRGDCQDRVWLGTKHNVVAQLFYHPMRRLRSSIGTKIKNYTAFSRAIDGAENIEAEFNSRRNANTFEVRPTKRRK